MNYNRRSVLNKAGVIAGVALSGGIATAQSQSGKEIQVSFEMSEAAWDQRMKLRGTEKDGIYHPEELPVTFTDTGSFTVIPQHLNPRDDNPNNDSDEDGWDNSLRRKQRLSSGSYPYLVESEDYNGKPGDRDWNDLVLRVERLD